MKEYEAIPEKGSGKEGKTSTKKEVVTIKFQWITNLEITEKYDLEHANSHNWNALKNHYLITQIADIFRQLYVYREIKKIGLK